MTGFPDKQTVERLREQFKSGITVELTSPMDDPYHPLPAGLRGECCGVDDAGQITAVLAGMFTGESFGAFTAGSNRSGDAFAEWRKEKMPVKVGQ